MASSVAQLKPEVLQYLSDEERLEAEALMGVQYGSQPFAEFISENFPHELPPSHIQPIIDLVERARHERVRVCLSFPPRHAKTVTLLRGIVWWLINNPGDTCAYYSYSDRQARKKSRICRDWARQCGIELNPDVENMGEWRNLHEGGLLAGGLQSGLTGDGVSGLFIVDDPFKNREEADSAVIREKVWDNFNEVVYTRLEGASVIVVHTRWHEDDLIGRLTRQKNPWEFIRIPGIAEDEDPLGREENEALWPDKHPIDELVEIKEQIGTRAFTALYQGSPAPAKGNIIKREWIRYYDELPPMNELTDWKQSWDCNLAKTKQPEKKGKKRKRSFVSGQVWARKGANLYLVDEYHKKPTFPQLITAFGNVSDKWPQALRKLVEDAAAGAPLISSLQDEIAGIIPITPVGSKEARLESASTFFEAGNVWFPRWAEPIVEELVTFPNAVNDDRADACSQALNDYKTPGADTDVAIDVGFGLKTETWRY